jgi:glycosidase
MDFSFFDKLAKAKKEETDAWWDGYNRLYNSFLYDYLYVDPTHVMAFVDNHDTDRFLENTQDADRLQCALALLLTAPRIPQLYYGTEILMNGTKEVTDGLVRKDFPGGFPGDQQNAFTAEGRTQAQQAMFQWLSRLLHWRQGNETIIRGYTTQFTPWKGVYVIARRWHRDTVITVINGTSKQAVFEVSRFAELLDTTATATSLKAVDVPTGRTFDLSRDVTLAPHEALVLNLE